MALFLSATVFLSNASSNNSTSNSDGAFHPVDGVSTSNSVGHTVDVSSINNSVFHTVDGTSNSSTASTSNDVVHQHLTYNHQNISCFIV